MLCLELPLLYFLFNPYCLQIFAINMTDHYPPDFNLRCVGIFHASFSTFLLASLLISFVFFLSAIPSISLS